MLPIICMVNGTETLMKYFNFCPLEENKNYFKIAF